MIVTVGHNRCGMSNNTVYRILNLHATPTPPSPPNHSVFTPSAARHLMKKTEKIRRLDEAGFSYERERLPRRRHS